MHWNNKHRGVERRQAHAAGGTQPRVALMTGSLTTLSHPYVCPPPDPVTCFWEGLSWQHNRRGVTVMHKNDKREGCSVGSSGAHDSTPGALGSLAERPARAQQPNV